MTPLSLNDLSEVSRDDLEFAYQELLSSLQEKFPKVNGLTKMEGRIYDIMKKAGVGYAVPYDRMYSYCYYDAPSEVCYDAKTFHTHVKRMRKKGVPIGTYSGVGYYLEKEWEHDKEYHS